MRKMFGKKKNENCERGNIVDAGRLTYNASLLDEITQHPAANRRCKRTDSGASPSLREHFAHSFYNKTEFLVRANGKTDRGGAAQKTSSTH